MVAVEFAPVKGRPDMCRECPLWAKSGHPVLFDHFIGAAEHGGWHCKAKRFGRLEIDDQLVFGRRPCKNAPTRA